MRYPEPKCTRLQEQAKGLLAQDCVQGSASTRHSSCMRILLLLFLISSCASAELKLSSQDEADIRAAIEAYAKKDNQRGTGEVWSERGPFVYRVRRTEPLTPDVAVAAADGLRTGGMNGGSRPYTFILTRTRGRWTVAKRIAVCDGEVTIRPISAGLQCAARGSWDYPN